MQKLLIGLLTIACFVGVIYAADTLYAGDVTTEYSMVGYPILYVDTFSTHAEDGLVSKVFPYDLINTRILALNGAGDSGYAYIFPTTYKPIWNVDSVAKNYLKAMSGFMIGDNSDADYFYIYYPIQGFWYLGTKGGTADSTASYEVIGWGKK